MSIQITVHNWEETPMVPVVKNDYAEACYSHFDTDGCFEAHMASEGLTKVENEAGGFDWIYREHEAPYLDFPRALRARFEDFFDCKLYDEESGSHSYPKEPIDLESCSTIKLYQFMNHCERHFLGAHLDNLRTLLEYMIANPSYGYFKVLG